MSVVGGVVDPNKPIGLNEIADLLECSKDVGSCCTSININIWSKRKPFEYDSPETPDDGVLEANNCGLNFIGARATSTAAINLGAWFYRRPTSWFRLTDFAGYDHYAPRPLPSLGNQQVNIHKGTPYTIDCSQEPVAQSALSDMNLMLGTTPLNNCYLGIVLINPNTNARRYFTNTTPGIITDIMFTPASGVSVELNVKYRAILFASDRALTNANQQTQSSAGNFLTLDQNQFVEIEFINLDGVHITVSLSGRKLVGNSSSAWTITGTIRLENNTNSQVTFRNIVLALESSASAGSQISGYQFEDATVGAQGTRTIRITGITAHGSYSNLWAYVSTTVDGVLHNSGHQLIMLFENADIS